MGLRRNGARSFLEVAQLCCKFSRMPGFRTGLDAILGSDTAGDLLDAFEPFCALIDFLVARDNWYNQKDHTDDDTAGEDAAPLG